MCGLFYYDWTWAIFWAISYDSLFPPWDKKKNVKSCISVSYNCTFISQFWLFSPHSSKKVRIARHKMSVLRKKKVKIARFNNSEKKTLTCEIQTLNCKNKVRILNSILNFPLLVFFTFLFKNWTGIFSECLKLTIKIQCNPKKYERLYLLHS